MPLYPPKLHQTTDRQKMIAVIEHFPLGMLVSAQHNQPLITHTPVIYNHTTQRLVAHIDIHNPQVAHLQNDHEVTVVFKGPDTYISPSVYKTPQLPTWNYIIVHLTGKVRPIDQPEKVKESLIQMTAFLEDSSSGFVLPPDHPKMNALLNYIHPFEIEITHWEGKFKLSQDKNKTDFLAAKEALRQSARRNWDDFVEQIFGTEWE
jgi:transcriptional regulator